MESAGCSSEDHAACRVAALLLLLLLVWILAWCFWRSSEDRGALISFLLSLEGAVK
jgi:hypothetical protein